MYKCAFRCNYYVYRWHIVYMCQYMLLVTCVVTAICTYIKIIHSYKSVILFVFQYHDLCFHLCSSGLLSDTSLCFYLCLDSLMIC